MKILKKQDNQALTNEERALLESWRNSPMARSLSEHLEKYYPKKADHGIIIEDLEYAASQ